MSKSYRLFQEYLDEHAATLPDKVAIECGNCTITYKTLADHSHKAAAMLQQAGLSSGDRVVYLGRSSIAFFELLYACARLGLCFVSLNWRLTTHEVADQLDDSMPGIIFADRTFVDGINAGRHAGVPLVPLDEGRAYNQWRSGAKGDATYESVDPAAPAIMMYTSGTTGRAKGVAVSQSAILASRKPGTAPGDWNVWSADEVELVPTPLFHIAGCGWALIGLYHGLKIVVLRDFIPADVIKTIEEKRITRAIFVPAMLAFLLKEPALATANLGSLKYLSYGASPMPAPLLKASLAAFPNAGFVQLYGMTETCGYATYLPPEDHAPDYEYRRASVGRAFKGVELSVRDTTGNALPVGEIGEVWIKTPTVMNGYWHNSAASKEVLEGAWYKTGDGGYLDKDGYLYLKDRIKDMIITGGENVFPSEIEAVIAAHPAIAEASVFGVPHEVWGEQVQLAVVLKPGQDVTPDALLAYAEKDLAGYKVPRAVHVMKALPRNASGKVLKRALREEFEAA
ncbi:AMP-binding protein [Kordiimonas aestuarii]|uniref:AMP-binding protein n=1 Tax=Kordiimonas aestuarii TaxID=1005925 RepID=UPI0021D018F6|nr:AMP-binding protein [Kordiimonas aestuarii]